ncbi:hypothetical protein [Terricaulis sp.]|uniref:hypothetical protein n=1 Tax=Terricaulis sp. TaxID=2768686 RepID=UPI0037839891
MPEKTEAGPLQTHVDALFAEAEAGGPGAAAAARRAALLTERIAPDTARAALAIAARLEPLAAEPRLALARMHAEAGDLAAARAEAAAIMSQTVDKAIAARASFIVGEVARAQGELGEARTAFAATLKIEDALLAADRSDADAARWYARARGRLAELDAYEGNLERARTGAEGALAMLRACAAQLGEPPEMAADIADAEMRLGALELDTNECASARRRLQEAIGRYEALILLEPNEPHWRGVLADAWALAAEADYVRNAPNDARIAMDKALQVRVKLAQANRRETPALAGMWRTRAALLAALNDAYGAAESLQQARHLAEHMFAATNAPDATGRFLTHTLLDQADHALRMGDLDMARNAAEKARSIAEGFAREAETAHAWLGDLAGCWNRVGAIARAKSAPTSALDAYARSLELRRQAFEAKREDAFGKRALAAALLVYGDAAFAAKQARTAANAFNESVTLRLELAERAPGAAAPARDLAVALERAGLAAQAEGDTQAARSAWEHELELVEHIFADPQSAEGQRFRAIIEAHLSSLGGVDAGVLRAAALARLDRLAHTGQLTDRDAALRRKLWGT